MEDTASTIRLTQFPNLTGHYSSNSDSNAFSKYSWSSSEFDISCDLLASAWAILLERYTCIDDPIFHLDGAAVRVATPWSSERRVLEVQTENGDRQDIAGSTSLVLATSPKTAHQHALSLCFDSKSRAFRLLASRKFMPQDFLPEFAKQLNGILEALDGRFSPPRNDTEARLSIDNWPPQRVPGPQYLHELLDRTEDHDVLAIEYQPSKGSPVHLSYYDLHAQADNLCQHILNRYAKLTVPIDTKPVVPMFIPQNPHLYVSMLAILKSGGAFCPLSLDSPQERIRFILTDIQAHMLLTVSEMRPKLIDLESDIDILYIDQLGGGVGGDSVEKASPEPGTDSPAYIMYTSGSTGQPKGVPISHAAATQAILAHDVHVPVFKRFLQFASPTFDVSVFEIFFPLFRGATLICTTRERLLVDLPRALRDLEVDAVELTPTVAGTLLRSRANVPKLKVLLTIGEMLNERVIREFGNSPTGNDGILLAMYGPTEVLHLDVN